MVNRKKVPMNVQRRLWADSLGRCMNPTCHAALFVRETNIGDMAHIHPHADNGDVSYANLILLCENCHSAIDKTRTENTEDLLRQWKDDRNNKIRAIFNKRFNSFVEFENKVSPILTKNLGIFKSFGPNSQQPNGSIKNFMWRKKEPEIIANNQKLVELFSLNSHLFHCENRSIVERFVAHVEEFKETRGHPKEVRSNFFPSELNSIFGIEEVDTAFAPNVGALQNFIRLLQNEGRSPDLVFTPEPVLSYNEVGRPITLSLSDRPRVQQIFWQNRCFSNICTRLRLENLVWILRWLESNDIQYEFDVTNVTRFCLNGQWKVVFVYEYVVSHAVMLGIAPEKDLAIVNLFNWNGGKFSGEAFQHAEQLGARPMTQNEFYIFCHEEVR